MDDLRDAFAGAGCKGVKTFIQSGNVVFESPRQTTAVFERIREKLRDLLGYEPGVLFRAARQLETILTAAPFKGFETEPGIKRYVVFLSQKPRSKPRLPLVSFKEGLEAVGMKNLDVFVVSRRKKNGCYGFPSNFIEKELGVRATSRNWSTMTKLVELVRKTCASRL
jgi:uncharacterized protein (DUF1697 family)